MQIVHSSSGWSILYSSSCKECDPAFVFETTSKVRRHTVLKIVCKLSYDWNCNLVHWVLNVLRLEACRTSHILSVHGRLSNVAKPSDNDNKDFLWFGISCSTEMFYAPIVLPAKPRPPELRLHQHQTPVELRLLQAGGRTCVGSWDL